ncbi:amylovoran biosynthesis protein AmsE [Lactiplantibacillus fabifermentans T30PCM01]|uniref:Amylovoran biosynthesis protein AmsE n=1 Tax=Lactiplantibacillus fabifermentans T30PCM01 TaxID=1400520 RepID=W6TBI7_9LACO|nr:glycosyltransferase [Lactiplantibacillus fabifermentans]ETY72710.1 amylovoran biosynthesis protein AmsE [Lactiplantibacillus fabifermentans T30PCM01]
MNFNYSGLMSVYREESPLLFNEALQSINNQVLLPSELIIVQDGPLPQVLEDLIYRYMKEFKEKGVECIILKNSVNLGLGKSLSKGLTFCNYEYVARFDSDDVSDKNRMLWSKCFFEAHPNYDVVGGHISEFTNDIDDYQSKRMVPIGFQSIKKSSNLRNPLNHMTVTFKKKAVLNAGNYRDMPLFEDYYLWLRMIKNGSEISNIDKVLVFAHVNLNTLQRRSGFHYFKKEIQFQRQLYSEKIISLPALMRNFFLRAVIRLLPLSILRQVYARLHKEG